MGAGELARAPMKSCFFGCSSCFHYKGGSVKNRDAPCDNGLGEAALSPLHLHNGEPPFGETAPLAGARGGKENCKTGGYPVLATGK